MAEKDIDGDILEYQRIIKQIGEYGRVEISNNYYPIAHTPIPIHNGIDITGTFETNDSTEAGRMSYVTILRDSASLDPANGYGFCWSKGDGSLYNIYLVDNSPLANDLFVNKDLVIQPQGDNAWKAAGKFVIAINTVYHFKLSVFEDYRMELRLWTSTEPVAPTLSCAAPNMLPSAIGTEFGISVMGTQNSLWWYNDVLITTSTGVHTAVLFKMKARDTDFPNGSNVAFNYYGYGHDGAGSPLYGISAFAWIINSGIGSWTPIGTNTSTNSSDKMTTKISYPFVMDSVHRDSGEFAYFLTTSTYASESVTNVSTYYAHLQSNIASGVHAGGCADIYVNDPSKIVLAENSLNNITGNINLTEGNGFYGPIHSIIEVQTALINDPLVRNSDWSVVSANLGAVYSTEEYPYLSFDPGLINMKVRVVYRYWQNGTNVQALLNSDKYRYSGSSNLAKITPPTIVTVNTLNYKGSPSETAVKLALKEYVNSATANISIADIANTLYNIGVVYIDFPNIDIEITKYNYLRVESDPVSLIDSYSLDSDLSAFFADETSLQGVTRI